MSDPCPPPASVPTNSWQTVPSRPWLQASPWQISQWPTMCRFPFLFFWARPSELEAKIKQSKLLVDCMWVKSAIRSMTEHSGQLDPAEALQRILAEQSQQIQSHDSTLRTILEQQRQATQQIEQLASLLKHASGLRAAAAVEGAAEPSASQHLPHVRDVTSPNPEKFSGEVGSTAS
ncbi:hypothetical protein AMECASPLE_018710 [Ameca splendens]|uniref:Uncharacterized protein n=1 Tax=Ameca splendens TaxID=208324 RepID=A0ABV0XFX5_9TELE